MKKNYMTSLPLKSWQFSIIKRLLKLSAKLRQRHCSVLKYKSINGNIFLALNEKQLV
jgi:hypothetical protein